MAARRSRCRVGASRGPPTSGTVRCSSRKESSAGVNTRSRAAANSSASGRPSSRTQISVSGRAERSVKEMPCGARASSNAIASLRRSATRSPSSDASGIGNGGTANSRSGARCNRSRLVASTHNRKQAAVICRASSATASRRCSQLSRTSSAARSGIASARPPRARVTSARNCCALRTGTRSIHATPSANRSTTISATARARRVLPTPGGPVSVTSRPSAIRSTTASISSTRPTSAVAGRGGALALSTPPS